MSFRLKEDHLTVLLDFMENHPDLATGRLSVTNAKEKFRELWMELSNILNSLGYGTRTVEKWQKTWTDYKMNLKKKASEIKRQQEATGGGPMMIKNLSKVELRALSLLGQTFFAGCGVKEQGLKSPPVSGEFETSCNKPSTSQVSHENAFSLHETDHSYLAESIPPPKKRKVGDKNMECYQETISILRNIDNSVNVRLQSLESTLNERLLELTQTTNMCLEKINESLKSFLNKEAEN